MLAHYFEQYMNQPRRWSVEWKHPRPLRKENSPLTTKVMLAMFWDEKGRILSDYLAHGNNHKQSHGLQDPRNKQKFLLGGPRKPSVPPRSGFLILSSFGTAQGSFERSFISSDVRDAVQKWLHNEP
ncbi:hypothetical protein TNCV_3188891 [Trichonephila clavipes]|nr:hypothetical protein TNCV_3188891 [Trichonephila clavipes]